MQIKELRLAGFKSFVDPVRVPIDAGLTGVVGPNGCGKSNLLESVRWVMGAASAKAMRGADMDDVIFAGTGQRPAREHAEVTLVLDNSDRKAPAAFNEAEILEVSRRIRREHGSTYKINGREVRAKDVQLLFADASTGANSPALVRQGQISELINAKPENRRRILEEAAGIGGLHSRRHEAELKLRAAEANLTRLDEVVAEIEAQAASLRKQSRQAERYRVVSEDLRRVEALLLMRRHADAQTALAAADAERRAAARAVAEAAENASVANRVSLEAGNRIPPLREEEAIAAAVLRGLETKRVNLERDLKDAEDAIARLDADIARIAADSEREERMRADAGEALLRLATERGGLSTHGDDKSALATLQKRLDEAETARIGAEGKLEAAAADAASREARSQALAAAAKDARARAVRAEQRLTSLAGERRAAALPEGFEKQRTALAKALADADKAVVDAQAALEKAETRATTAEQAERVAHAPMRVAEAKAGELEAETRALEKLAAAPAPTKFKPVLDVLRVKPGYERAIAAALGDDVHGALDAKAPARWTGADASKIDWPKGVEPLSKFVEAPAPLAARLALCGVAEKADAAKLASTLPPGARLVSREGDLWRWDGFVREAGAEAAGVAARLEQANRLEAAKADLAKAQAAYREANAAWEKARTEKDAAEAALKIARAALPTATGKALQARAAVERHDAEGERVKALAAGLEAQDQALHAELEEAQTIAKRTEQEAQAANAAPASGLDLAQARSTADAARAQAAEARAAVTALTREREARASRLAAVDAESAQWKARDDAAKTRLAALAKSHTDASTKLAQAKSAPGVVRDALAKLQEETDAAEARRSAAADKLAAAETRLRESERSARTADEMHAQERENRAGADARVLAAQAKLADVVSHIHEHADAAPGDLPARAGDLLHGPLAAGPIADVERKADRLRAERDAAGPVNLRAEEELTEIQTRLETLLTEKADVAAAVSKLRRGINELNAEGRERLLRAFEIVNGHFAALFATLFEGGQAELRLTEPDETTGEDPLNAGLEIYACPPGKRLSALSLMSGGEQALTATALIFAVFLANPAPLCVLDEVDAPLDDSNVDRFCSMLDEMRRRTQTRFLVITHNPMTMSRMDRLYGVTMAERGVSQLVSVDLAHARELAA